MQGWKKPYSRWCNQSSWTGTSHNIPNRDCMYPTSLNQNDIVSHQTGLVPASSRICASRENTSSKFAFDCNAFLATLSQLRMRYSLSSCNRYRRASHMQIIPATGQTPTKLSIYKNTTRSLASTHDQWFIENHDRILQVRTKTAKETKSWHLKFLRACCSLELMALNIFAPLGRVGWEKQYVFFMMYCYSRLAWALPTSEKREGMFQLFSMTMRSYHTGIWPSCWRKTAQTF